MLLLAFDISTGLETHVSDTNRSPLYIAAANGHADTVGAIQDLFTYTGEKTPDMMPVHAAASNGHLVIVKKFMAKGEPYPKTKAGRTLLHLAASNGNLEMVKYLVKDQGFEADETCVDHTESYFLKQQGCSLGEYTALMIALADRNEAAAEFLLSHSTHLSSETSLRRTPLHLAALAGYEKIFHGLLSKGLDPLAADMFNETPFFLAAENGDKPGNRAILEWYLAKNAFHEEATASQGFDINHANALGETALHRALIGNQKDTFGLLLQHGADASVTTSQGYGLACYISHKGDADMLEHLKERGIPLDDRNDHGYTALHEAASSGNLACLEALLDHFEGAFDQEHHLGRTPLSLASAAGHQSTVDALIDCGADLVGPQDFQGLRPFDYLVDNPDFESIVTTWRPKYQKSLEKDKSRTIKTHLLTLLRNFQQANVYARETLVEQVLPYAFKADAKLDACKTLFNLRVIRAAPGNLFCRVIDAIYVKELCFICQRIYVAYVLIPAFVMTAFNGRGKNGQNVVQ